MVDVELLDEAMLHEHVPDQHLQREPIRLALQLEDIEAPLVRLFQHRAQGAELLTAERLLFYLARLFVHVVARFHIPIRIFWLHLLGGLIGREVPVLAQEGEQRAGNVGVVRHQALVRGFFHLDAPQLAFDLAQSRDVLMRDPDDGVARNGIYVSLGEDAAVPRRLHTLLVLLLDGQIDFVGRVWLSKRINHRLVGRAPLRALDPEGAAHGRKVVQVEPQALALAEAEDVALEPDGLAKHLARRSIAGNEVPVERKEQQRVGRCLQQRCVKPAPNHSPPP